MPTENELKYVLDINSEKAITRVAKSSYHIKQGYLFSKSGTTLRIRKSTFSSKKKEKEKFVLCFKQNTGERLLEIEKTINKRDFDDLWNLAKNKLEKIRYEISVRGELWEVDYFRDGIETYFAMAEHEMPEGVLEPSFIPEIIEKYLLFSVQRDDDRFTSRKISNIKYAKELFETIKEI